MIDAGELDRLGMSGFAERLGVGPRHLSRLFAEQVGASPSQVARTSRLQRAKRLLDETTLTIADIAVQSGYSSARRLTDDFTARYGRTPTKLRKKPRPAVHLADPHITLSS